MIDRVFLASFIIRRKIRSQYRGIGNDYFEYLWKIIDENNKVKGQALYSEGIFDWPMEDLDRMKYSAPLG